MQEIDASELVALLGSALIVDVREPDEFRSGHVEGAVLMPLSTVPVRMTELDHDQTYFVICEAGGRSAKACEFLEKQGYDVINVAGGTGFFRSTGLPLVTGD
ncbi:MAG: rhodanese-like domain-containing protein [Actinomycetes bacterium]